MSGQGRVDPPKRGKEIDDPLEAFARERKDRISRYADNGEWRSRSEAWLAESFRNKYVYNFDWAGVPIIQYPQDIVALQEIIWRTRPDLIIETGIAHGGSLSLSASMLAMLDYCDAASTEAPLDPRAKGRSVIGIDIDIRPHNRRIIEAHPLSHKVQMIEGSSTDKGVIAEVYRRAKDFKRIQICFDSFHTHDHVLAELEAYAPLVTPGNYCVVFDTFIENMTPGSFPDRPWDVGNNPGTALCHYLGLLDKPGRKAADGAPLTLIPDTSLELKLAITSAPHGYLRRPG